MPRDQRLWMTFPIDFWMHPKIAPLSDAAFRAFVEMNGYSRQHRLDGRIPHAVAMRLWGDVVLNELCGTHPERPVLCADPDGFVLRDYAEHQETAAQEDARKARNRANGAKGGRPSKTQSVTESVTESVSGSGAKSGAHSKAESESESESEDFYSPSRSQSRSNRVSVSTDAIDVSPMTKRLAAQKGITSLRVVVDAVARHTSARVTADQAFQLCTHLLDKAKAYPDAPQRYVLACIKQNPAEVEKHLFDQIGVVA